MSESFSHHHTPSARRAPVLALPVPSGSRTGTSGTLGPPVHEAVHRRASAAGSGLVRALSWSIILLVLCCAGGWLSGQAHAAAPLDNRSTAPNDRSELAGSGYLLTDPLNRASRAYWAGAYDTVAGLKSYGVDDLYDYPRPSYGYRTAEVSGWVGRTGSNIGASGHTGQRIVWIVNSYGQSPSRDVDAAVSMAINRLTGSAPFDRSYRSYFLPQLNAINPAIPGLIDSMLADSDMFAGPYTTRVTFGVAPGVGGSGQFAVSVRSAMGYPVRNAPFRVVRLGGGALLSASNGSTGATGVVRLRYASIQSGRVTALAVGLAPNSTVRLGSSVSHSGTAFVSGSQRVLMRSATPLGAAAAGIGWVSVGPSPLVSPQSISPVLRSPVLRSPVLRSPESAGHGDP
jgi:hypothetical protein